jgi:hypothetical protein
MRKGKLQVLAIALIATSAVPAQARLVAPGHSLSWGKPGVSLEDYRSDAVACGRQAAAVDLRGTGPAKSFVLASRLIENAFTLEDTTNAMWIASPERNFGKAGDIMKEALDGCLIAKGYRQFKLTGAQQKKLGKLPTGSLQRHAYLHSLASNPDILAHQTPN